MEKMIVTEELVVNCEAAPFSEIVSAVSQKLQALGFVKDSYAAAICAREAVYPTGLAGKCGCFAIPHTDSEHCLKSTIAVVRPEPAVRFVRMDDHAETVDCPLILMLAVADPAGQLPVLRKLMRALQNEEVYRTLTEEKDTKRVAECLRGQLFPA